MSFPWSLSLGPMAGTTRDQWLSHVVGSRYLVSPSYVHQSSMRLDETAVVGRKDLSQRQTVLKWRLIALAESKIHPLRAAWHGNSFHRDYFSSVGLL